MQNFLQFIHLLCNTYTQYRVIHDHRHNDRPYASCPEMNGHCESVGLILCVSRPSDIWQPKLNRRKNARLIKNWNVVRTWTALNVVTSWTWIGWYPDNVSILQTCKCLTEKCLPHRCGEWLSFLDSNDSNASPCSSSTAGKRTRLSAPPEKTLMNLELLCLPEICDSDFPCVSGNSVKPCLWPRS